MLIYRQKEFRRDEYNENWQLPIDPEILKNFSEYEINHPKIIITSPTKEFNDNQKQLSYIDKGILKKLEKDVKNNYWKEDGPAGGDTHFLEDFSGKKFSTFSKKINENDRFNYRVYPLEIAVDIDPQTNENIIYLTRKITYTSCLGHRIDGVGDYLDPKVKKIHQYKHRNNGTNS